MWKMMDHRVFISCVHIARYRVACIAAQHAYTQKVKQSKEKHLVGLVAKEMNVVKLLINILETEGLVPAL